MKQLLYSISILSLFSLTACFGPSYYYQLQSMDERTEWYMGRPYSISEKDSIRVRCSLMDAQRLQGVFMVEITNLRKVPIEINPKDFYALYAASADSFASKGLYFWAYDPESRIAENKNSMSQEEYQYSLAQMSRLGEGVLNLAVGIANINKKETEEERKRREDHEYRRERQKAERDATHIARMSQYSQNLAYWENSTLRRTTLYPGQSIENQVVYPLPGTNTQLLFCFRTDSTINTFRYQQVCIVRP